MANEDNNSSAVSIFAMVLLTIVVLVILYFVFRGFLFSGDKEIDVNINPGGEGSYNLILDKNQIAEYRMPEIQVFMKNGVL